MRTHLTTLQERVSQAVWLITGAGKGFFSDIDKRSEEWILKRERQKATVGRKTSTNYETKCLKRNERARPIINRMASRAL